MSSNGWLIISIIIANNSVIRAAFKNEWAFWQPENNTLSNEVGPNVDFSAKLPDFDSTDGVSLTAQRRASKVEVEADGVLPNVVLGGFVLAVAMVAILVVVVAVGEKRSQPLPRTEAGLIRGDHHKDGGRKSRHRTGRKHKHDEVLPHQKDLSTIPLRGSKQSGKSRKQGQDDLTSADKNSNMTFIVIDKESGKSRADNKPGDTDASDISEVVSARNTAYSQLIAGDSAIITLDMGANMSVCGDTSLQTRLTHGHMINSHEPVDQSTISKPRRRPNISISESARKTVSGSSAINAVVKSVAGPHIKDSRESDSDGVEVIEL